MCLSEEVAEAMSKLSPIERLTQSVVRGLRLALLLSFCQCKKLISAFFEEVRGGLLSLGERDVKVPLWTRNASCLLFIVL